MRSLFRAVFCMSLILVLCVLAIHIFAVVQARKGVILERRALALQPGKATLQDLQMLVRQHGSPDDYVDQCDEKECHVSMSAVSFSFLHPSFDLKALRALGLRPANYAAIIDLINGRVERVEFSVFYRKRDGEWFRAATHQITDFSEKDRCENLALVRHPGYAVITGTNDRRVPKMFINAGVSTRATAQEISRAQSLDLTCVTSLRECTLSDLMPLAYSDRLADSAWEQDHHQLISANESQCKQQQEASASWSLSRPWWATGWRRNPL